MSPKSRAPPGGLCALRYMIAVCSLCATPNRAPADEHRLVLSIGAHFKETLPLTDRAVLTAVQAMTSDRRRRPALDAVIAFLSDALTSRTKDPP